MVAEVGAMREGVEEEHKRLTERSAALERQKRETDLTARAERERLGEEVHYHARCAGKQLTHSQPSIRCKSVPDNVGLWHQACPSSILDRLQQCPPGKACSSNFVPVL